MREKPWAVPAKQTFHSNKFSMFLQAQVYKNDSFIPGDLQMSIGQIGSETSGSFVPHRLVFPFYLKGSRYVLYKTDYCY